MFFVIYGIIMDTIFNFGNPRKDFSGIANCLLGDYEEIEVPHTYVPIYRRNIQIVSGCYGHSQTWDTLCVMMKEI